MPLAIGYGVSAVAAFVLVGLPQLGDATVDEQVATVDSVAAAQADPPIDEPDSTTAAGDQAADKGDGGRVLTLTDFETDPGPDLRMYLTAQDPADGGEIGEFVDLGALKGNVGDQQYEISDDIDIDTLSNAVVWCRAFSVGFTSAALTAS